MPLYIIIFVILAASVSVQAQEADEQDYIQLQIDSLLSTITPKTHDSTKKRIYYSIGVLADNTDTALKYANLSLDLTQPNDYKFIADNNYNIGVGYFMENKSREALKYFFKSKAVFEKIKFKKKIADNNIAIGKCYHDLNLHDSSLTYLGEALELFTELKDTANITYSYISIGLVNFDLNFCETAKEYYLKALRLDSLAGNNLDAAYDYQLLGDMELANDNIENALLYLTKSSYIFDTIPTDDAYYINAKYETYISLALAYISYAEQNNNKIHADCCLNYITKIGDYFISNNYSNNQFSTLQCYSRYLMFVGKDQEALKVLLECQKYLEEDQRDSYISEYYRHLTDVYKKLGDYKNALEASDKMHRYKESSINDSTMNVVAKFQTEQEMKIHKAETEAKQKHMRIIIFSLLVGLILVTLLVFYILKALKIKHQANQELSDKNQILNSQKAEIEAQRDEILSQKNIITEQWHEVENVNHKLLSSIIYAERIQRAVISKPEEVKEIFPDSFVFYRPRDIVSGDFYWCGKCGKYSVMITADCTGHGIPGGFLSMLGISALKEFCVTENDAANPGTILDRIRHFIKTTLVSAGKNLDDGMDMTICNFDFKAMELHYAIANQTALLIRNGKATKLKGDSMPVGNYVREKEHFQSLIIPIQKGDMIYTFSDGIQDQLGGSTESRKFLFANLLEILIENAEKQLDYQCQVLEKKITDWQGNTPQIDDMTLVGIRV
ncbi:MAG: SpoIIE family protein phosphatase [Bacteroidales bacterium]|nr:SpoIIE family protein phosphatase [Bacteroidales bacterium]